MYTQKRENILFDEPEIANRCGEIRSKARMEKKKPSTQPLNNKITKTPN